MNIKQQDRIKLNTLYPYVYIKCFYVVPVSNLQIRQDAKQNK